MANFSFKKTAEEIDQFTSGRNTTWMHKCEGLYIAWASDQETIQKILPPPLKAVGPVVTSYIINCREPQFTNSYKEAALMVPCQYNGQPGSWSFGMILEGSDNAVFTGRENLGIPKKNGKVSLSRIGDICKAKVERYGTTIMDVECELGAYNTPSAPALFGEKGPGAKSPGKSILYKFDLESHEDGTKSFSNLRLLEFKTESHFYAWTPGTASVKLQSTVNDPWGQLPVLQVIGAAWGKWDLGLLGAKITPKDNIDEVIPHLLTRYDAPVFGYPNRVL